MIRTSYLLLLSVLDDPAQLAAVVVVAPEVLGKRLRAARILAGLHSAEDLSDRLAAEFEIDVSPRALYSYERGEVVPTIELFFAIVAVLDPPGGMRFFSPAIDPEVLRRTTGSKVSPR